MFDLFLGSQSRKFLKKIDKNYRFRLWSKIDKLKTNPFPSDMKRIIGEKRKAFRVRVGSYRIKYYVLHDKKEIIVFRIDKREKAY